MDHPNAYPSRKLNKAERNYLMTEQEGLRMIFSLQKLWYYLVANPFIFKSPGTKVFDQKNSSSWKNFLMVAPISRI